MCIRTWAEGRTLIWGSAIQPVHSVSIGPARQPVSLNGEAVAWRKGYPQAAWSMRRLPMPGPEEEGHEGHPPPPSPGKKDDRKDILEPSLGLLSRPHRERVAIMDQEMVLFPHRSLKRRS